MIKPWQTLDSEKIYEDQFIKIVKDEIHHGNGDEGSYIYIDRLDFASVIPMDGDGKFCLVNQWRYTVGRESWEFPRGGREDGETIEASGRRELLEETGLIAETFTSIGAASIAVPITNQEYLVFIAQGLTQDNHQRDESEEDMEVAMFSLEEIEKMIETGKIHDGVTITSFYFLKKYIRA